ncbi:MAG: bifunctional riboflavin kinase/FAD synthetase [Lachnobacterium sp.]|nr:bifunctional riboflavin kinase/FAD synthetase [Lachnobacterium sp.]
MMQYIHNTFDFKIEEDTVITLGKFDGLHRGHELLMENLLNWREKYRYKAVVFTFDIPPRQQVNGVDTRVLTTNEEKRAIFERSGVDYLIECPFTPEVMCMEPKAFIEWMVNALHARCFVIGNDFRFGHNRAGDYEVLRQYAVEFGYEVVVLDKIQEDGRDISSTYIREEIGQGHIEKANNLLGYEFFAKSMIIHGKQLGRKIGIPTINMEFPPEKLLPPNGVYVTRVLMDGVWHKGVTNVGCKPTVSDSHLIGVETHILDFSGNVYGKEAEVCFLHYIRPEQKFASIEDLQAQMERDVMTSRQFNG